MTLKVVTNCDYLRAKGKKMNGQTGVVPMERIERAILSIRGEKVMLDSDLAELYGVETKALNQAVKRNLSRFPPDFMFQLTKTERAEVVTNCDHLIHLKFSSNLPYAFTEHGALMLANVLNSERAAQTSVQVVRAFIRLRQMLASNAELARKLDAMEKKYDARFRIVFCGFRGRVGCGKKLALLPKNRKRVRFQP